MSKKMNQEAGGESSEELRATNETRLEELYAEADRRGCCVIPATPIPSEK